MPNTNVDPKRMLDSSTKTRLGNHDVAEKLLKVETFNQHFVYEPRVYEYNN
jgi:hypothetical protein